MMGSENVLTGIYFNEFLRSTDVVFGWTPTVVCLCRQVLSNGSLYVEPAVAEEGSYHCRASVAGVGVLLSRMAHVRIACKLTHCFVVGSLFSFLLGVLTAVK